MDSEVKGEHGRSCLVAATSAVAAALILVACSPDARTSSATLDAVTAAARVGSPARALPANGRFDYQIGGPYPPAPSVAVVDRDRHEAPVRGTYNICYVNAFQTQPEEKAFWTGQYPDLLVKKNGTLLSDPNWPDEYLLDTSTAAKRMRLAAIEARWVEGCARSGFQAVEPDNLDSWTRSQGMLTKAGNVAFATLLAAQAHKKDLAIAQKNTSELGGTGKTQVGFDFAIAEECQVFDECGDYTDVYGTSVAEIEYTDNPRSAYTRACTAQGKRISVILRDRDIVARGQDGYHYESC